MGYNLKDLTLLDEEGIPKLVLLKTTYTKQERKCHLAVIKDTKGGACNCKGEALSEGETVVAVEYTYDPESFTVMCVPCAMHFKIVGEPGSTSAPAKPLVVKKKKTESQESKGGSQDMANVDLKAKLAPKAGAKAAPPVKKPLAVEEDDDEDTGVDEEEKPETDEEDDEAEPEEEAAPAIKSSKIAKTPAALKEKVAEIDNAPHTDGMTKADVLGIVEAALLEFEKRLALKFKEVRTDYAKAGVSMLEEITRKLETEFTNMGGYMETNFSVLAKIQDQISKTAVAKTPAPTATAPVEETPAKRGPGRPPGAKNKKDEAPAEEAPKPAGKRPKVKDFVTSQMTDEGLDLEALGDIMHTMGYFPSLSAEELAEDKEQFLSDLTEVLESKGFTVTDGIVSL